MPTGDCLEEVAAIRTVISTKNCTMCIGNGRKCLTAINNDVSGVLVAPNVRTFSDLHCGYSGRPGGLVACLH